MSLSSCFDFERHSLLTSFIFLSLQTSFKFLRIFPLSQDDLPGPSNRSILPFPSIGIDATGSSSTSSAPTPTLSTPPEIESNKVEEFEEKDRAKLIMSRELEVQNPLIDYTHPELITFVFSDVGVLATSGVGDALLSVYSDQ